VCVCVCSLMARNERNKDHNPENLLWIRGPVNIFFVSRKLCMREQNCFFGQYITEAKATAPVSWV
jgi:hypothetical protein